MANPSVSHRPLLFVVDDDELMRLFLLRHLGAEFDVMAFGSVSTALDRLREGHVPSAIVLDLDIPEVTGDVLVEAVRRSPSLAHLPILVLSGKDESSSKVRLLEAGADDFVTKPFSPLELSARLRSLLRRAA